MLSMCKTIFGTGEAVVLDSGFCVSNDITELESKGDYAGSLIKKRYYRTKVFTGNLIDTHFKYKEVSDIDVIEARTQENKSFQIICTKEPDYLINIMASCMTLDD